jgi:hypothetical protein
MDLFAQPALCITIMAAAVTAACGGCSTDAARSPQPRAAQQVSATEREQVIAQASAAVQPFKQRLAQALTGAMAQNGPVAAIDVCSREAPRLAAEASTPAITVGRSALKLRNPDNAARPWLQPVLNELAALPSPEGSQRVVGLGDQRFGYAEALTHKPLCATCHGTDVSAEVSAKLRERYPKDQATGFQLGQLRGVVWAEVALAKP